MMCTSFVTLPMTYKFVLQFTQIFHLSLALMKSGLWGSRPSELLPLSQASGIPIIDTLTALGAEWQLTKTAKVEHKKDVQRVASLENRLARVEHLPCHPSLKANAVAVACLSLIDYLPAPVPKIYSSVRAKVRRALSLTSGAPEIIYNIPCKCVLHPPDRIFISLLRLWYHAVRLPDFHIFADSRSPERSKGRLGHFLSLCAKRNCVVDRESITFHAAPGDLTLRFAQGWPSLRAKVTDHIKNLAFLKLQERRPASYTAPYQCDWRAHKKLYSSVSAYESITLMRIWSGVAMTKAHAFTLKIEDSPDCLCGLGIENIDHILWHCPMRARGRPMDLMWWSTLAPASSMCLICPYGESVPFVRDWRRVNAWALKVVSGLANTQAASHIPPPLPASQDDDMVAYREIKGQRKKDMHFLTMRECGKSQELPLPFGHYMKTHDHIVQLTVSPWKISSVRPRLCCQVCGSQQWATAPYRHPCRV